MGFILCVKSVHNQRGNKASQVKPAVHPSLFGALQNLPFVKHLNDIHLAVLTAGWRMANPAMRIAILAACADTFYVLIDGLHFEPRGVDEFSKRRATLALRQPAEMGGENVETPGRR
jgi:hypothetical protein